MCEATTRLNGTGCNIDGPVFDYVHSMESVVIACKKHHRNAHRSPMFYCVPGLSAQLPAKVTASDRVSNSALAFKPRPFSNITSAYRRWAKIAEFAQIRWIPRCFGSFHPMSCNFPNVFRRSPTREKKTAGSRAIGHDSFGDPAVSWKSYWLSPHSHE